MEFGSWRSLHAARLGSKELRVEGVCKTRDDLVLHIEEIRELLVEPLCPYMRSALGVDELHADAHAVAFVR